MPPDKSRRRKTPFSFPICMSCLVRIISFFVVLAATVPFVYSTISERGEQATRSDDLEAMDSLPRRYEHSRTTARVPGVSGRNVANSAISSDAIVWKVLRKDLGEGPLPRDLGEGPLPRSVGHSRQRCRPQSSAQRRGGDGRDVAAGREFGLLVDGRLGHGARSVLDDKVERSQEAADVCSVVALTVQRLEFESGIKECLEERKGQQFECEFMVSEIGTYLSESFATRPQLALSVGAGKGILQVDHGEALLQHFQGADTDVAFLQHQGPELGKTAVHVARGAFLAVEEVHAAAWENLTRDLTSVLVLEVDGLELCTLVGVVVALLGTAARHADRVEGFSRTRSPGGLFVHRC